MAGGSQPSGKKDAAIISGSNEVTSVKATTTSPTIEEKISTFSSHRDTRVSI
jgi:hypothetical protein